MLGAHSILPTALEERRAWALALRAIDVLAAHRSAGLTTGAVLRAAAGPVREAWLERLKMRTGAPVIKLPASISEERLLGGVDLSATLAAGRVIQQNGLLDEAVEQAAILLVPMAEMLPRLISHHLSRLIDEAAPGLTLILLDEADANDDQPAIDEGLRDRLPLHLDLNRLSWRATMLSAAQLEEARAPETLVEDAARQLTIAAFQFGLTSSRPAQQALSVLAAVNDDFGAAVELSLLGRALVIPDVNPGHDEQTPPPQPEQQADNDNDPPDDPDSSDDREQQNETIPDELVLDAVLAELPAGLLAQITAENTSRRKQGDAGRTGAVQKSSQRGRPIGSRPGDLRAGERLHLTDTLRAAIPHQRLRARRPGQTGRISVRKSDFRLRRYQDKRDSLTLFAVDASGSTALNRLSEAKGAIELLLADSYSRRDNVGLIAFRGEGAELLLPPTRALTRAKRLLGGLPGGGATPLAAGIELAQRTAEAARSRGQSVTTVLITDGSANVARDGRTGRGPASEDAEAAAERWGLSDCGNLLIIDVAKRPSATARGLSETMGGVYLPLPRANAERLSDSVKALR